MSDGASVGFGARAGAAGMVVTFEMPVAATVVASRWGSASSACVAGWGCAMDEARASLRLALALELVATTLETLACRDIGTRP